MTKKRRYLIIGVLIALVAGIYFLFAGDSGIGQNGASSGNSHVEFNNMEMKETANGEVTWYLKAKKVTIDADKDTAHLEGVEGYFKKGDNEFHLNANTGLVKRAEKTVHLEGSVKGHTKDGAVLSAENLDYDGKTQVLSTSKPFTVERDGKTLTADKFTADRVLEEIKAQGHAKLVEKGE